MLYDVLAFPHHANPFTRKAKRKFRFCVPEEWYRRPGDRNAPSRADKGLTVTDGHSSLSNNDSEGEGTAKAIKSAQPVAPSSVKEATEKRISATQNRLSSMITGFLLPSPPTTSFTPDNAVVSTNKLKTVSEPVLLEQQHTGNSVRTVDEDGSSIEDIDVDAFEAMLVCNTGDFLFEFF